MANETILVVEDTPASLKHMATLLRAEGYKVHIASTAEQALTALRTLHPHLILTGTHLPGMSGIELTRRVKQDAHLREIVVLALAGGGESTDEQRVREAGCDVCLTKPIDDRTLTTRVRACLGASGNMAPGSPATAPAIPDTPRQSLAESEPLLLPESEMEDLRRSFLLEGTVQCRHLLASLDAGFDATKASGVVHQWVGTGGLLGFPTISQRSREVEMLLREPPWSLVRLRSCLTNLADAFADPGVAVTDVPLPEFIVQELAGKRIALIAFDEVEAERLCAALGRVGARPRLFDACDQPDCAPIRECSAVMVHVRPETLGVEWLSPDFLAPPLLPLVLVGARERLLGLDPGVQSRAREFLIDGWQPEEALMRLSFALSRTTGTASTHPAAAAPAGAQTETSPPAEGKAVTAETEIVVADDDATVRALVERALENDGIECRLASNGIEALQLIRDHRPRVAVLDVNMPGLDGFEVLAAIRAEALPVRVILLTARQLQNDVIRGFSLGAADYVIKPFRPLELVARLRRLLGA